MKLEDFKKTMSSILGVAPKNEEQEVVIDANVDVEALKTENEQLKKENEELKAKLAEIETAFAELLNDEEAGEIKAVNKANFYKVKGI